MTATPGHLDLRVGYEPFHRNTFMNYQFNRWYSLGRMPREEVAEVAGRTRNFSDWRREFSRIGERALAEGRLENAAFAYRAAEFLTPPSHPDKPVLYERFIELFDSAFDGLGFERHAVPFDGGQLPVLRLAPSGRPRGTVLVHGGFDSFIEEWIVVLQYLAVSGYEVIGFEGPGQGGALRHHGLRFSHDWEEPTAAVLDHFGLTGVTLMGISMGGYWCLRAAAFEPRIERVVVVASVLDWLEQLPPRARQLVQVMVRRRRFMNASVRLRMRLLPVLDHAVSQCLMQIDGDQPIDAVDWLLQMNADHQHPERVTQDVLLLHGAKDRFQPLKLHHAQRRALENARSVTERIFTEEEHASSHCQMGNLGLLLEEIVGWLDLHHE